MRKSITKIGVDMFLNKIKFNKEYYILYNNIFNNRLEFTEEIFIYFILQISHQNKFHGNFDELYLYVVKRKLDYIKELIINFRTSYIGESSFYDKFIKTFGCVKLTDKEIYFNRNITILEIDNLFNNHFELDNKDKKDKFIFICEKLYNIKVTPDLQQKIYAKFNEQIEKKTYFSSYKIFINN
jgi:hypothetical protein